MKRITPVLCALLLAILTGCSGATFRASDALPDMKRGGAEWRGPMVGPVFESRHYMAHCFLTKKSETSPGTVMACSSQPEVVAEMYEAPYNGSPGSSPTIVRFDYTPVGGDQQRAIGPETKEALLKALNSAVEAEDASELMACRRVVNALDSILGQIQVGLAGQDPPDHHDIGRGIALGREAVMAYAEEFPGQIGNAPTCAETAKDLVQIVEAAPLTGYLSITGRFSWKR